VTGRPEGVTKLLNSTIRPGAPAPIHLGLYTATTGTIDKRVCTQHRLSLPVGAPVRIARDRTGRIGSWTREGELDIVPAGDAGIWIEAAPARTFLICLSPGLLDRVADEQSARVELESGPALDAGLVQIAHALRTELEAGELSGRIYLESLALALCARLTVQFGQPKSVAAGPALPPRRLRQVKDFIEANLDQDLSLEVIAGVAGSSPSHFKVLFRRATGLPLHQYVIRRRVERARQLLERTEMPIDEIALEVGFAHQSHLARWTRRLLGATPRQLAKPGRTPLTGTEG
jgi:AraC family transcriptional regulator